MEFSQDDFDRLLLFEHTRKTAEANYAENPQDADVRIVLHYTLINLSSFYDLLCSHRTCFVSEFVRFLLEVMYVMYNSCQYCFSVISLCHITTLKIGRTKLRYNAIIIELEFYRVLRITKVCVTGLCGLPRWNSNSCWKTTQPASKRLYLSFL